MDRVKPRQTLGTGRGRTSGRGAGNRQGVTPFTLADLERIIGQRATASPEESYTARLLVDPPKAAKKLGEEAMEAAIAAVMNDRKHLTAEAADVLYHLLVVLRSAGVPLADVMEELRRRTTRSGLDEKASRRS